jgi:hypothetical protein
MLRAKKFAKSCKKITYSSDLKYKIRPACNAENELGTMTLRALAKLLKVNDAIRFVDL